MARTGDKRLNDDVISTSTKKARFSIDNLLEPKDELVPQLPVSVSSSPVDEVAVTPPLRDTVSEISSVLRGDALDGMNCKLEGAELWAKFFDLGTEMIITKSGRRMFPTVKVSVSNIDPEALFYVFLDVVPVDNKRYRYIYNKSAWLTAGKAEPAPKNRLYLHPDAPFTGDQLMKQVVSFEKAKLTNNEVDRTGHLILNSMHKYQPRIHIVRRSKGQHLDPNKMQLSQEVHRTLVFPETQFMAVTAYQNQLITKLKIEKNPFAKGFRDPSGRSPEYDPEPRDGAPMMLSPMYNQAVLQQALLNQYYMKAARSMPTLPPSIFSQMLLSNMAFPFYTSSVSPKTEGVPI